jgi:signal transduction histidine kinase
MPTGNIERVRADMSHIVNATNKMQRLLSELLDLSRIGRMIDSPVNVPFNLIVQEAVDLMHGRLTQMCVTVTIAENMPTVNGDRTRLVQVMQNLIDNAVKFMGRQTDPCIEIGQRGEDDGKPIFFIRDNGMGIPSEYHEKIFGIFNKLDPGAEGTGIGLSLVKRIIDAHGGRVWVESEVGKGSTFCFSLPNST